MAAAPGKKKPPTPPKPPLGRLHGDSPKESVQNGGKDSVIHLLKTKTEVSSANVIKCSNDRPYIKPPLLPKPQTPPKPLATSPGTRPLIPKRPNLVIPSTSTTKAPVAKLEEFDSFNDGPVRPPRSPKTQPFKGEPFKVFEEKPELPLKKKQLNCTEINVQRFQAQWKTTKEKSASLGRTNAFRYFEAKSKSASLGRNRTGDFATYSEIEKQLEDECMPVPPPRQRKKSCEHSRAIPVYAQVNYNMKKNRRQAAEDTSVCAECNEEEEETEEDLTVVEGKLVLPGTKSVEMNTEESKQKDNKEEAVNGCVISEDKTPSMSVLDVISVDNDAVDSRTVVTSEESEVAHSHLEDSKQIPVESNNSELYRIVSLRRTLSDAEDKNAKEIDLKETTVDLVIDKESKGETSVESSTLECEELAGNKASKCKTDADDLPSLANSDNEISIDNIVEDDCCNEVFIQDDVARSDAAKQVPAGICHSESTNKTSLEPECRLSTSSLPTRRKLEMKEPGKFHRRRQSWSSGKDNSPSPEKPLHHKRRLKPRSWWCDDGELSSGALADLDSSDNAARQSSFEEVDWGNSDVEEDRHPVRSKLSCWLGSFGKGNRKHKVRRDSNSQFYCDDHDSTVEEKDMPVIGVTEVEAEGFVAVEDCSRPASGLSTLSALDIDEKSDPPVSEESFDMYQHSESENEGDTSMEVGNDGFESEESRLNKKAFYIAQELMTSERVFIDVLKLLNVDFRHAVRAASSEHKYSIIPNAELDKILITLPQLQHLNEDLLRDLEYRIENWSSIKKISDVIVRKGPFLKLYTSYIKNFEFQCNYLEECCQKYPRFAKMVKEFEASPRCRKLSLKHYMLKPVQRIPQYRLLLEDYLQHLSASSPDKEDTEAALKIVCDVADHANRSIKLGDHLSKLLQLQSQLGNYEIIKPGRIFLKDGELFKLSRKGMQPRYFILLNDCLLYTSYYGSVQSSGLKVNYELPLCSMKVSTPQAEDYRNEFSIISVRRSFTLCARSLQERQEWVDALQKAITDFLSRQLSFQNMKITAYSGSENTTEPFKLGQEAPVWIQDSRVTMCQSCTAVFTVTFRRHHCRGCGKVVCGDCSDFRAPLQYMRFQLERVCENCYETLYKEAIDPSSKMHQAMRRELGNTVKITETFKRLGPASGRKIKKFIPRRLKEVTANDTGSQISGWLQRKGRRSWKRFWFVLKEQVLYVYKASEDVVALESIPVLGYSVEPMRERHFQLYEGVDAKLVFQLTHPGQHPFIFHADTEHLANRWIAAMCEATVLK